MMSVKAFRLLKGVRIMDTTIIIGLINNSALLMTLVIVYEISYIIPVQWRQFTPVINGLLIGIIGLGIMLLHFQLTDGIFFDTRSILISVTALTYGTIPALVASVILMIYRLILGGAGAVMGISVILSSALAGILWRKFILKNHSKYRWLNIYLFGIVVHIIMLACTFTLPWPVSYEVFQAISLPVLLIYPIGTVLLSLLLLRQKERNESLIQISEAEERYKSLFNNSLAVMLLIDPEDGTILDANPAAAKFYDWSIDTIKSMHISQINTLSPEDVKVEMNKSATEKRNHFFFRHRKACGDIVDVEVYSGPIRLDGKVVIYSIVHDISQRIAANNALLESEQRFRLLVESAPEAIFIQTEGRFSFANQYAYQLFGTESPDQLIGSSVMDRFDPEFHATVESRMYTLNIEKRPLLPTEEVFLKMDGTPVDVDVTAVPIHYDGKDGALVFARDITDRKRLEHSKNEIQAQLRQQQKLEAIGTLAGGVAHEINNPINGIMNYAQLILDQNERNSEEENQYAKEIINETERIAVIVKNLLQFSRQEKQSHSYASIYDIINQTISLINTVVKKDQITLDVQLDENLPDIKCRSQQIQQVLMNLLTNARDALNEKYKDYDEDKIIRVRCSLYHSEGRRWLKITVEDHGNGIPEELLDKVFEPFFSTKPKEIGTGLGLSISFGIVKDHHGKITIDTKKGCYTKFILDLPVDNGWTLE